MIVIAGHLLVDEADRAACVDAHRDLVRRARAFDGCLELSISADSVDSRRVNNLEVWEDAGALDSWRSQADAPDHAIEPLGGSMQRYDATDGGPLF